jgi:glutamate dehydrogenase/leucine dehydrogenase
MKEPIYRGIESEVIREVKDESVGLHGFLVINSRVNGLTCGGVRIHEDISVQELQDHAKVMELKQAFIGLPRGGARAGIIASYDLSNEEKQKLMNRFAENVKEELTDRRWLAAIDIGTNLYLIQNMYKHIGVDIPAPSKEIDNAGYYTAVGVLKSIEISLKIKNRKLEESTFAIEGFGNVGSHLAKILHDRGGKVIALSSSDGAIFDQNGLEIQEIFDQFGRTKRIGSYDKARKIPREALLELDVDVLCPCAVDSTIYSENMKKIKAEIICAGANNPVTLAADEYLYNKGVLYLPDFMTNAGGALGNMVKFAGLTERHFHQLINDQFTAKIIEVYGLSQSENIPPREAGIRMADDKFDRMKADKEEASKSNALYEFALSIYRKGWIPKILLRPFAFRQLQNLIAR